MNKLFP